MSFWIAIFSSGIDGMTCHTVELKGWSLGLLLVSLSFAAVYSWSYIECELCLLNFVLKFSKEVHNCIQIKNKKLFFSCNFILL